MKEKPSSTSKKMDTAINQIRLHIIKAFTPITQESFQKYLHTNNKSTLFRNYTIKFPDRRQSRVATAFGSGSTFFSRLSKLHRIKFFFLTLICDFFDILSADIQLATWTDTTITVCSSLEVETVYSIFSSSCIPFKRS